MQRNGDALRMVERKYSDVASYTSMPVPDKELARSKKFRLNGWTYEQFDGKGVLRRIPLFTPEVEEFELFFFCDLFHLAVREHPLKKKRLHVTLLSSLSQQLLHILNLDRYRSEAELGRHVYADEDSYCFFGHHEVFLELEWLTWEHVRDELLETGHPVVHLSLAERIYKCLEDMQSCVLAGCYFSMIIAVTVTNLSGIMFPGLRTFLASNVLHIEKDTADFLFHTGCIYVFTFDFCAKIFLVPFVRVHCLDIAALKEMAVDTKALVAPIEYSAIKKVEHFCSQPGNMVDFFAIAPFWISVCFGELGLNTSFFRLFRLARIFRLVRSARHFQLFNVLATTLVRSASMVFVLVILTGILGLICGCLLQQFEVDNEAFSTVPLAWFWIVGRLISLRDAPSEEGMVFSKAGVTLLVLVMSTKGVLMILPIARIKQIFVEEFMHVTEVANMRQELWDELMHRTIEDDWSGHQGMAWGRLHLLSEAGDVTKTAQFALPLLYGTSLKVQRIHVQFPYGFFESCPSVNISLEWNERATDEQGAIVLPWGSLTLKLSEPYGIPESAAFRVDIPFQVFGYTSRRLQLNEAENFDIAWSLGPGPLQSRTSTHSMLSSRALPRREDEPDHAEIVSMLREQSQQLQKIMKTLDAGQKSPTL